MYINENPSYYEIAIRLVQNNRYKEEIRNRILQTDVETAEKYLHIFDKKTDKIILAEVAAYIRSNLKDNPFASFLESGIIASYYGLKRDELSTGDVFENDDAKRWMDKMHNLNAGKTFDEYRNNYWRAVAKNALRYYEARKNKDK